MHRVITLMLAAIVGVAVSMSTASANAAHDGVFGTTFVDGGGATTDDWSDHFGELGHSLCNGCADSWNTDLVLIWQAVLVAEGFLGISDLDGKFGPRTDAATRSFQNRYIGGSGVDGKVGNQTWSTADNFLFWDQFGNLHYLGVNGGDVVFFRGNGAFGSGAYELVAVNAAGHQAYHLASPAGNFIRFHSRTITIS